MSRRRGRPLGYARPPAGTGNGLDWMGGAPVAGQVRSERVAWAAGEKETGVGVLVGLQVPLVSLLVHRPRIRAQPSCRICRLLSLPRTNRPQVWGAHILSPTLRTQPAVPIFPRPASTSTAHLSTGVSSPRWVSGVGGAAGGGRCSDKPRCQRPSLLGITFPSGGVGEVQPGSAGWGR